MSIYYTQFTHRLVLIRVVSGKTPQRSRGVINFLRLHYRDQPITRFREAIRRNLLDQ